VSESILLIRADAGIAIGIGHVMRCLALAQAWQDSGGDVVFAMAQPMPSMRDRLLSDGVSVDSIEAVPGSREDAACVAELARQRGVAWVVVDGYHFDARYQRELKAAGMQVLFVDDNGQASPYAADIVLNQNANARPDLYQKRAPYTRLLLGSSYVLLRKEFKPWRDWVREIPDLGRKILITMGGSDPDNVTLKAIHALTQAKVQGLEAAVVVGRGNPHLESIEQMVSKDGLSIRLHRDVTDMPKLIAWADMVLAAAGGTLWELLFMGCPVLSFARNDVQRAIVSELAAQGVVQDLGHPEKSDSASIGAAIAELGRSPGQRRRMSQLGRKCIDGRGAERICELLITHEVRN